MTSSRPRLTEMAHGGGCGCKLAPAVLQDILKKMPIPVPCAALLVGTETADDAAVYRLNDTQAIIATTDFFTPIVDDPYDFGRIAATNALSDVYAMGGTPIFALALVGMPVATMPIDMAQDILAGGAAVCAQAGIPVVGGHSIDTPEPIYGLVAVGLVHPDKVLKNANARAGDVLILTKALGVGIFSAAMKKGELDAAGYQAMVDSATRLNTIGAALSDLPDVHAMTDVTGFGLLGHLLEMARGAGIAGDAARRRRAAAGRRAGPGRAGLRDRGGGPQLDELRARRGAAAGHGGLAAGPALRSADQRRPADRGGARAGRRRPAALPRGRLRAGGGDRRDGRGRRTGDGGLSGASGAAVRQSRPRWTRWMIGSRTASGISGSSRAPALLPRPGTMVRRPAISPA